MAAGDKLLLDSDLTDYLLLDSDLTDVLLLEDAAAGGGRIMGSLADNGGLAGSGGLAGKHGGLAG